MPINNNGVNNTNNTTDLNKTEKKSDETLAHKTTKVETSKEEPSSNTIQNDKNSPINKSDSSLQNKNIQNKELMELQSEIFTKAMNSKEDTNIQALEVFDAITTNDQKKVTSLCKAGVDLTNPIGDAGFSAIELATISMDVSPKTLDTLLDNCTYKDLLTENNNHNIPLVVALRTLDNDKKLKVFKSHIQEDQPTLEKANGKSFTLNKLDTKNEFVKNNIKTFINAQGTPAA